MEIKLSDNEIREILVEGLREKMSHTIAIDPDACWFEVMSNQANGEIEDIFDVKFCYNTEE